MRILLTGASSFTGYWFARALAGAGHEIVAVTRRPIAAYEPPRRRRIALLRGVCDVVEQRPFGGEAFLDLLTRADRFDALCHHGAEVTGYRDPGFDAMAATGANTSQADRVLQLFSDRGGRALVVTGTVFEPDEGAGTQPLRAFSAYGLSKAMTWQALRFQAARYPIAVGKFTIPNPFGPFEEPRFTTYLCRTWFARQRADVQTPDYVRDNIHADLLAEAYAAFVARSVEAGTGELRANPSGYIESQGEFVARMSRELRARLGWPCDFDLRVAQTRWDEPRIRVNTHPAAVDFTTWSEGRAWDAMAQWADAGCSAVEEVDIAC